MALLLGSISSTSITRVPSPVASQQNSVGLSPISLSYPMRNPSNSRFRVVTNAENPAPGISGTQVPLGGITSSVPLEQDPNVPAGQRIAYICQDCGYVYKGETVFQDVPEEYKCPVCAAPKNRFKQENANVEDVLDETEDGNFKDTLAS